MPSELENYLRKGATKKHLTGERKNAYIFGTMRKKAGWKPSREKKRKGK